MTHGDSDRDAGADETYLYTDGDRRPFSHAHGDPNAFPYPAADGHLHSVPDGYARAHADHHAHGASHVHPAAGHPHPTSHAQPRAHGERNPASHAFPYPLPVSHGDRAAHSFADRHALPDADPFGHSGAHCGTYPDACSPDAPAVCPLRG